MLRRGAQYHKNKSSEKELDRRNYFSTLTRGKVTMREISMIVIVVGFAVYVPFSPEVGGKLKQKLKQKQHRDQRFKRSGEVEIVILEE